VGDQGDWFAIRAFFAVSFLVNRDIARSAEIFRTFGVDDDLVADGYDML